MNEITKLKFDNFIAEYNNICDKLTLFRSLPRMDKITISNIKNLEQRKIGIEGYLDSENIEYTKR